MEPPNTHIDHAVLRSLGGDATLVNFRRLTRTATCPAGRAVAGDAAQMAFGAVASIVVAVMVGQQREARHLEPVWRDRSNFIIAADISSQGAVASREQLWARQISGSQFELCCIPFFLYDVALGDIVEVDAAGPRKYLIRSVVQPSGRYVFRVWFGEPYQPRDEIAQALENRNALLEWSSQNLLAVDARDAMHGQVIADFLTDRERKGQLIYEAGKSRVS